jgi:hypothetical protein
VGAVTPLAVVVTPLVWGKDYPHRGEKVKLSLKPRLATHGMEATINMDDLGCCLGEPI